MFLSAVETAAETVVTVVAAVREEALAAAKLETL